MTGFIIGFGSASVAGFAWHWIVLSRIQRYADRQASRLPVSDPVGAAYFDMGTVVSLGGRCEDRIKPNLRRPLRRPPSPTTTEPQP